MRAHELNEAIVGRPRNLGHYLRTRVAGLAAMQERAKAIAELVARYDRDGASMLASWLRQAGVDGEVAADLHGLEYLATRLEHFVPLERLHDSLDGYVRFGPDFLQYVINTLDDVKPLDQRYLDVLAVLDKANAGAALYGFVAGDPANDEDAEYVAAMKLRDAYLELRAIIAAFTAMVAEMRPKLAVLQQMQAAQWQQKDFRVAHGEVEVLYHATAYADEVARDGFAAEKPVGRRGLGNFGEQDGISFTHDLKVAIDVMRALREACMIAHGELTSGQIINWAVREGTLEQLRKAFRGHQGKPLTNRMPPLDTIYLYRYYLAFSPLRSDPVFTYPDEVVESLRGRKVSDIGVVECQVRLTQQDHYLPAESEFRLPADRVQSIRRIR